MPTTSFHEWNLPIVGGDADAWGEKLNAVFDALDEEVIEKGPTEGSPPKPVPDAGDSGRWYLGTDTVDPRSGNDTPLPFLFYDDGNQWIIIWDGDAKTLGGTAAGSYLTSSDAIDADTLDGAEASAFALGSRFPLPNSDLQNSTLSVAGNAVGLGGSTGVALPDLSDVNTGTPTSGQALTYNGGGYWEAADVASGSADTIEDIVDGQAIHASYSADGTQPSAPPTGEVTLWIDDS
ncbi:hypothetical protein [Halomarina rubra]|uniref:Minor tail protein n=1 Tax=Halomarina rubra TaxID=2071873 RepID=A0ABD6B0L1_9EURY|nr:hypothetical protein [Halomarina rubra]